MADYTSGNSFVAGEQVTPHCPVGESQCMVIDQLTSLQSEVAKLAEQVRTDTLTGLFNFRHFQITLEQEMERTRRTAQTTALIMVDLDHFKQVNDNWGHEVGNQALIAAANAIRGSTRRLDIVCRYGGEEFAIILPSTDLMTAITIAERVRTAIVTKPLVVVGENQLSLTASFGVDVYSEQQTEVPEQFVERADEYLYQAKQQGRNRVCHGVIDMGGADASVSKEERELLSGFFGGKEND